ncbi:MAG: hypothetical protein HYX75_13000 [Acidobacteria bacterium]|nr:hypothetical protein [Acidobacteriota bacterium]
MKKEESATTRVAKRRLTKLTPPDGHHHVHTEAALASALAKSFGLVGAAAKALRVSRAALYKRIAASQALRDVVEAGRELLIDQAEAALRQAVRRGESWAVLFTLKTIGRGRGYVERTEIEIAHRMSTEELMDYLLKHRKLLEEAGDDQSAVN